MSRAEATACELATELYRKFMELVYACVDEMSEKCAKKAMESKDARRKAKAAERHIGDQLAV